jgi:hypothetical protein
MLVLNRFLSPPNMFKDRLRMFQFMWFLSLWISVSEISILGQTLTPFHSHDVLIISIHSQKFWNKEINFGDFSFLKSSLLFEDLIECSKSGLSKTSHSIPFALTPQNLPILSLSCFGTSKWFTWLLVNAIMYSSTTIKRKIFWGNMVSKYKSMCQVTIVFLQIKISHFQYCKQYQAVTYSLITSQLSDERRYNENNYYVFLRRQLKQSRGFSDTEGSWQICSRCFSIFLLHIAMLRYFSQRSQNIS